MTKMGNGLEFSIKIKQSTNEPDYSILTNIFTYINKMIY